MEQYPMPQIGEVWTYKGVSWRVHQIHNEAAIFKNLSTGKISKALAIRLIRSRSDWNNWRPPDETPTEWEEKAPPPERGTIEI